MTGPDDDRLARSIASGSEYDRWELAGSEDLPEWGFHAILDHDERGAVGMIATNRATPVGVLDRIAARNDELSDLARVNQNASVALKDGSKLAQHSHQSVDIYLTQRGASLEQRKAFADLHRHARMDSSPLVSEAWAEAVRSTSSPDTPKGT